MKLIWCQQCSRLGFRGICRTHIVVLRSHRRSERWASSPACSPSSWSASGSNDGRSSTWWRPAGVSHQGLCSTHTLKLWTITPWKYEGCEKQQMYLCADNYRTVKENQVILTQLWASSWTVPYSSTQLTCPADPEADRRPPVHSSSRTSRTRVGSVPSGSGASPPVPASPAWTDRRWRTRWRSDCILLGGRKDLSSAISEELHSLWKCSYPWLPLVSGCRSMSVSPTDSSRDQAKNGTALLWGANQSANRETVHLKKRDLQAVAASFRRGWRSTARVQSQRWLTFTWICGT